MKKKYKQKITKKDFSNFMKVLLNKSSKTDIGVPKRPKKAELETAYKIVKVDDGYKMIEVDK